MIPIMHDQIGVTESLAGWLAGWNYIGYLVGLFIVWLIGNLQAKDFFLSLWTSCCGYFNLGDGCQ
jgi:uncharacterized membrane protein